MGSDIVRPDWGAAVPAHGGRETLGSTLVPEIRHEPFPDNSRRPARTRRPRGREVVDADDLRALGLPSAILESWTRDPAGPAVRLRNAQAAVSIFDELHDDERRELERGWYWLAEGARVAVLEEFGLGSVGSVRRAPQETIDKFKDTIEGDILARHWGQGTARSDRKIAVVLTRLNRIKDNLDPWEADELDAWIDSMSVRQIVAACIALAD